MKKLNSIGLDKLRKIALSQIPRILGLGDRKEGSKTYGCFDRYYWHYGLLDFPNVRFQEAVLLLSLLYKEPFEGNSYYKNEKILSWVKATLEFWTRIQHLNGSFDENYPFEYSFVGTAFSTYAAAEAMINTGVETKEMRRSLERAGDWLIRHTNPDVANQIAGSISALHSVYTLCNTERHKLGCGRKLEELLRMQDREGFFFEYGGYDIGYMSIALSYLADYYCKTGDARLKGPLSKALDFMKIHVKEDGTFDCKPTSRKTQYIYPRGLLLPGAEAILARCVYGINENRILNPTWMDDRFCIPLTIDYLKTYIIHGKESRKV